MNKENGSSNPQHVKCLSTDTCSLISEAGIKREQNYINPPENKSCLLAVIGLFDANRG